MSKPRRSHIKRTVNPMAVRLSEPELVQFMLRPHVHLSLLLSEGRPNPLYLSSIIGIFNVAMALAYMHKDIRSIHLYESIQRPLLEVATVGISTPELGQRLRRVFTIADRYISAQAKADLLRAIRLVEHELAHGNENDLLHAER
ncbi:MAG: hypothetical protein KGP14_06460 [Betaproteobacteria bacterium]|nr:hypothetical protein [Betaproteobacteria bacterium]